MAAEVAASPREVRVVPGSLIQVEKLTRYQLREYLRSSRFLVMLGIVLALGAIITVVVAHFRSQIITTNHAFYAGFWGMAAYVVIVLAAVFFGGDAIAGEFQNKTGYFLMGLPIRRAAVYAGKFIAAFLAALAMLLLFLGILVANATYYFGANALPWQLWLSLLLAIVYLAAVLGVTFLFSSMFKTGAYGFVITAIMFIIGFSILQELIIGLFNIEPWMVISYAQTSIGGVFSSTANWGLSGTSGPGLFGSIQFTAGISESIVIMFAYFFLSAFAGLVLFEREEFS